MSAGCLHIQISRGKRGASTALRGKGGCTNFNPISADFSRAFELVFRSFGCQYNEFIRRTFERPVVFSARGREYAAVLNCFPGKERTHGTWERPSTAIVWRVHAYCYQGKMEKLDDALVFWCHCLYSAVLCLLSLICAVSVGVRARVELS